MNGTRMSAMSRELSPIAQIAIFPATSVSRRNRERHLRVLAQIKTANFSRTFVLSNAPYFSGMAKAGKTLSLRAFPCRVKRKKEFVPLFRLTQRRIVTFITINIRGAHLFHSRVLHVRTNWWKMRENRRTGEQRDKDKE